MWIGPSSLNAFMQGILIEWSPPKITGIAFDSKIFLTPNSIFLWLEIVSV